MESYTRAAYRRRFEGGEPAGEEPNTAGSLREAGQNLGRVLELAQAARIVKALSVATDEAMALGVFGSPTFVVAGEVFWDDDRSEDAIRRADVQRNKT